MVVLNFVYYEYQLTLREGGETNYIHYDLV